MRYGITQLVGGSPGFVEITEQEYRAISLARHNLLEVLYLEEKFDLVTEDYFEYETELLSSSTRFMIFGNQDPAWMQNERNLISRRMINLLSAGRLYLDQSTHHLHNIYGDDPAKMGELESIKSTQYDTRVGFRVMEALRNYVQHRGFPIHSVTFSWHVIDIKPEARNKVLFALTPYIKPAELEDDPKFKRAVLKELKAIGDEVDIKPLVRDYVECLSRVQNKAREILRDNVLVWETKVNEAIGIFKSAFGIENITGLAIVIESEDGIYTESEYIFNDFSERRRKLERKNGLLISLSSHYVSNETIEERA